MCCAFRQDVAAKDNSGLLVWHAAAAFVDRSTANQSMELGTLWAAGSLATLQSQVGKSSKVCLPAQRI